MVGYNSEKQRYAIQHKRAVMKSAKLDFALRN